MKREIAEQVIARCRREGAEAVEVYLQRASHLKLSVRDGKLDVVNRARGEGVGVRCVIDGVLGFAYAPGFTSRHLESVATNACKAARVRAQFGRGDAVLPRPGGPLTEQDLNIFCSELELAPLQQKLEVALAMERGVRANGSRPVSAIYTETIYEVAIVSSSGIDGYYRKSDCTGHVNAVYETKGESQWASALTCGHKLEDLQPEASGAEAALLARRLSHARTAPTGRYPALLGPEVMGLIVSALGLSFCASRVQRGDSLLCWLPDHQIASPAVTLVDDGLYPGGMASAPCDAEGMPRRRTVLIERGKRQSLLYDTSTAHKAQSEIAGGNAARKSYQARPSVSPSNLIMYPGSSTPEELVASIPHGLWVTSVAGANFGLDPSSGRFSLVAKGLWIERGCPSHAVDGVMITGHLVEILRDIQALGSDVRWLPGYGSQAWTYAPSALLSKITVIGNRKLQTDSPPYIRRG